MASIPSDAAGPGNALPSPSPPAVLAGLSTLVVATITLLSVFELVQWSTVQTSLVLAESAAVIALATATVAHRRAGTPKEHVAVAATFTAAVSATLALGSGFGWWTLTEAQTSAMIGMITAVLGIGGAMYAREKVSPR